MDSAHASRGKNLTMLKEINLSSNKIILLRAELFQPLKSIKEINLLENPLICDHELESLKIWSDSRNLSLRGTCKLDIGTRGWNNRKSEELSSKITEAHNQTDIQMPIWLFTFIIACSNLFIFIISWLIIKFVFYRRNLYNTPEQNRTYNTNNHLIDFPELLKTFQDKSGSNQCPVSNMRCQDEYHPTVMDDGYLEPRKISGEVLKDSVSKDDEMQYHYIETQDGALQNDVMETQDGGLQYDYIEIGDGMCTKLREFP